MGMACLGAAALAAPPVVGLAASAHAQTAQAEVSLAGIREAATRLKGQVQRTPLVAGGLLSERCGANIVLKLENMQYTGSFKERGALNKMSTLTPMQRGKGVIAASTGNHAQGVAHHATRLGIPSIIVMPHGTPEMKIGHTRALGGEVVLQGDTFDDALSFALEKAANDGLTFIHPFEDPLIICGQGTIGLEIMHDLPNVDVLVAPVGGGGLISGCATAAKTMKPDLKVYGVEVANYAAMRQRLHRQPVQAGGETIAEGIAVRNVGERTFSIVENLVEDVLTVEEVNVERAIALLFELRKVVAEGGRRRGRGRTAGTWRAFRGQKRGGRGDGRKYRFPALRHASAQGAGPRRQPGQPARGLAQRGLLRPACGTSGPKRRSGGIIAIRSRVPCGVGQDPRV